MRSLLMAAALLAAHRALAQSADTTATIVGVVRDASDSGVVGLAEIRVAGGPSRRADGLGRFRVERIIAGPAQITVRVLGYTPLSVERRLDAGDNALGDLYLVRIPAMLSQVTVRGRAMRVPSGFERIYSRARFSPGQFLTREQIDSMNPHSVADLLATATNLRVRWTGARYAAMIRNCVASVWFNGLPVNTRDHVNLESYLAAAHPMTLQVVEVYDSPLKIPMEFKTDPTTRSHSCAAILIWTRAR